VGTASRRQFNHTFLATVALPSAWPPRGRRGCHDTGRAGKDVEAVRVLPPGLEDPDLVQTAVGMRIRDGISPPCTTEGNPGSGRPTWEMLEGYRNRLGESTENPWGPWTDGGASARFRAAAGRPTLLAFSKGIETGLGQRFLRTSLSIHSVLSKCALSSEGLIAVTPLAEDLFHRDDDLI
jgi:hypothetical protein